MGESGCGKSITAQSIMRIEPHSAKIVGGEILYYPDDDASNVINIAQYKKSAKQVDRFRGKDISMIFQEPMTSLCPVYTAETR